MELRELEAFLALADELHFGRAAERLTVSQGRVSQLLAALERRIGGRLLERTSRSAALTPLGARLLADLRPAYAALRNAVAGAAEEARGVAGTLRLGFVGIPDSVFQELAQTFRDRYPCSDVSIVEAPLADPFGPLQRGEADVMLLRGPLVGPVPGVQVGPAVCRGPRGLALSARHPLAGRDSLAAEELAEVPLIGVPEDAPRAWRELFAPERTPAGRTIASGCRANTLQEALSLAAAGRGGLLFGLEAADYLFRRDIAFVPVDGLPDGNLSLVRPLGPPTPRVAAFAALVADFTPAGAG
ncbi:hypothetical protein BIV57_19630 [Mangrovactinospora gilvigrisea]|uniref:HTH lysR-type domain-containing protein n=1 Tax=Mangrovactinospora gilvigrisea TaxID=1428644 RepID=A0A1J7BAX1_9ACTN|nr:hypothetical protein BIV57_19630 [Mangrovactinospora gilvigrisea]